VRQNFIFAQNTETKRGKVAWKGKKLLKSLWIVEKLSSFLWSLSPSTLNSIQVFLYLAVFHLSESSEILYLLWVIKAHFCIFRIYNLKSGLKFCKFWNAMENGTNINFFVNKFKYKNLTFLF
jgi:hypothetical protein